MCQWRFIAHANSSSLQMQRRRVTIRRIGQAGKINKGEIMKAKMKSKGVAFGFLLLALGGILIAGWVTNVIWTFKQDGWAILLGVLGVFFAPIGALHGLSLWF